MKLGQQQKKGSELLDSDLTTRLSLAPERWRIRFDRLDDIVWPGLGAAQFKQFESKLMLVPFFLPRDAFPVQMFAPMLTVGRI